MMRDEHLIEQIRQGEVGAMHTQDKHRPIGELATAGDLVFVIPSRFHGFGQIVSVSETNVTYRRLQGPVAREIAIPAQWPAFWKVTEKGRCLVVKEYPSDEPFADSGASPGFA